LNYAEPITKNGVASVEQTNHSLNFTLIKVKGYLGYEAIVKRVVNLKRRKKKMSTDLLHDKSDTWIVGNYESLALRTAPKDYFPLVERCLKHRALISSILYDLREAGKKADLLKREIYYGSPQDFGAVEQYDFRIDGYENRISNPQVIDLLHAVLGLGSENTEIIEALEKHLYGGEELDRVNIGEEQGDLHWYQALLTKVTGVWSATAKVANIKKLVKRYPAGFTEADAVTRNLGAERKQLEADLT
jgi:hypothetical protein